MIKLPPVFAIISLAMLTACAGTPNSGHVSRADSMISTSGVSASTTSRAGTRARTSVTVGNRSTPGRVHINARSTSDGLSIAPSFSSDFLNWSFR